MSHTHKMSTMTMMKIPAKIMIMSIMTPPLMTIPLMTNEGYRRN